jgi:hypothetical protein
MSEIDTNKRYFESVLMGNSGRKTKEDIARKGLLLIDRTERVLNIHKANRNGTAEKCVNCQTTYPCQTRRSLTGE